MLWALNYFVYPTSRSVCHSLWIQFRFTLRDLLLSPPIPQRTIFHIVLFSVKPRYPNFSANDSRDQCLLWVTLAKNIKHSISRGALYAILNFGRGYPRLNGRPSTSSTMRLSMLFWNGITCSLSPAGWRALYSGTRWSCYLFGRCSHFPLVEKID